MALEVWAQGLMISEKRPKLNSITSSLTKKRNPKLSIFGTLNLRFCLKNRNLGLMLPLTKI